MMPVYSDTVREGARQYRRYLAELPQSGTCPDELGRALDTLASSLDRALEKESKLRVEDVTLEVQHLRDREPLLNAWVLGLGNPLARIVSIGTEPAFNLHEEASANELDAAALEMCAPHILWLSGDVAGAISSRIRGQQARASFHRNPTEVHGVKDLTHTWGKLALLLAAQEAEQARSLLAGPLFEQTYQLDLSYFPARRVKDGRRRSSEARVTFVERLLASLPSAEVLLLHGDLEGGPGHRSHLTASFLRISPDELQTKQIRGVVRGRKVSAKFVFAHANGRCVLRTYALTAAVDATYWAIVAEAIASRQLPRGGWHRI